MKRVVQFILIICLGIGLSSCGGDDAGTSDTNKPVPSDNGGSDKNGSVAGNLDYQAASVWDGHSLRSQPGPKEGKWLASLAFGEPMTLTGETKEDEKSKKTYVEVELRDEKKGWVRGDLIENGGKLGVIKEGGSIYSRPGVTNITNKSIGKGTLVVMLDQEGDEWTRFIAKNDAKGSRERGWVLGNGVITTNDIDIAVAVIISKAKSEKVPSKRKQMLDNILNNSSYSSSAFYSMAEALADEPEPKELSETQLMITGNVVNVRSGQSINEDNVVFQVEAGDVCEVVEKGSMDEIKGNTDYWYKISLGGQTGWIFGSNTSRKLN